MNIPCDIHLHTCYSDGHDTPAQVVARVAAKGLGLMAITDHDTVEGVAEGIAAAEKAGIRCLAGVELSTYLDQEIHILGYNVPYYDPAFLQHIAQLQAMRRERVQRVVTKLRHHGIKLVVRDELDSPSAGRSHIAELLVAQGFVRTKAEAFDKYLGKGAPCYVEGGRISPAEGVRLLASVEAVAVLAHPFRMLQSATLDRLVADLVAEGLGGIEVYYPNYNAAVRAQLRGVAMRHDLICTGGSDYHCADWGAAVGEAQAFLDPHARRVLLDETED